MNYSENIWDQNIFKRNSKDGVSVSEIIDLYLDRCRKAKDVYDKKVSAYRPFESRLCEIINDTVKDYFDGRVDVSNIEKSEGIWSFNSEFYTSMLNTAENFRKYNDLLIVNLEDIWKKEGYGNDINPYRCFFPNVYIDENFEVFIPDHTFPSSENYYSSTNSIINKEICNKLRQSILNHKDELMALKNKSDKYQSFDYEDILNKNKKDIIDAVNGISVKLDNDITLRFSLNNDKDFLESKFNRENVTVEAYDKNYKLIFSNNNGFTALDKPKEVLTVNNGFVKKETLEASSKDVRKNYDKILRFTSDSNCVWKLMTPFDMEKQIDSNNEFTNAVISEKELDRALEKAVTISKNRENEIKELEGQVEENLKKYEDSVEKLERLTGKVNSERISGMNEEMLFQKDSNGVLHVKDKYRNSLRFFDLSLINWDNVDIRYLDFTGSNASINPQLVAGKKCNGIVCKYGDCPFTEFSNFDGVDFGDATIESPNMAFNFEGSKMNENTNILTKGFKKSKGKDTYEKNNGSNVERKKVILSTDESYGETVSLFDDLEDTKPNLFNMDDLEDTKPDLAPLGYLDENSIIDNYRNKDRNNSYNKNTSNVDSRADVLNSLANGLGNGSITLDDIYLFLNRYENEKSNTNVGKSL